MCRVDRQNSSSLQNQGGDDKPPKTWQLWAFGFLLFMDAATAILVLTPILPGSRHWEGKTNHYTLYGSLIDLAILAALRLKAAVFALAISYYRNEEPPQPFSLYHPNGDKKSREELDQEALEEAISLWLRRFIRRPSFACEVFALVTQILALLKCLSRMNVEIGTFADAQPLHPMFWVAIALTSLFSVLESATTDTMTTEMRKLGRYRRRRRQVQGTETSNSWLRRIGSNLSVPLLARDASADAEDVEETAAVEPNTEEVRGVSDIHADANYKASWADLLSICKPDAHLILLAFVFLLMAALAQVYIPKFTGKILDALESAFQNHKESKHDSMWEIPGFMSNVKKLVIASVLGGIFSGFRGSIFTVVGGRVNVRLRIRLMDSLLTQDIGFFDTTKTGDITSRLSSDTTLVGDQVTLNVNVFLRSLVQAIGVLAFMFMVSWQLSILAFISVPVITVLSKWYGNYIRDLTKLMQKKLADGNSVSESVIGSMSTVRAFDAAESELKEFETYMEKYMRLNIRAAVAYVGYSSCVTALPQLVTALVVFYGGLIVRNGDMTSGELVSFLLYLSSLSDAFANIGYIFSSLTQAVGAADKVFELMHRKPRIKTSSREPPNLPLPRGFLGVVAKKTVTQRHAGMHPATCRGEITLENVDLCYPARPQRRILNGISLKIPAGSVVALVGQSGGGKSSVMSLLQHLYEPSAGKVLIDEYEVHELSPLWLSRNVSVVSQEPTLFGRSIKRNIKFGLEGTDVEPTDDEVKEAARLANAASFIEGMPLGYETDVGERGVQLSGGQKQRIAIARALVRKPRILLLDEATSALDSESEALVQEAIDDMIARGRGAGDGLSGGMTVLIVAHRLSTIRNADIIFVVQDGRVVEQGSHNELIEKPEGAYKSLISRQIAAQQKLENGKT